MADAYSGKLHIWDDWTTATATTAEMDARGFQGPHQATEFAERMYAGEALYVDPHEHEGTEPFSLQWYLDVENARHSKHARWIPKLLEFAKHRGERLLGLGNGLGTDWVQYARHGADVVVCSPSEEQLSLIQRNFQLRGLRGLFLHPDPANLPLPSASIDVVCVNGLLQELTEPRSVIDEVYRVLKPGGKALAATPARYDVDFWCHNWLPWRRGKSKEPSRTYECCTARVTYSGRRLRKLFDRFVEHRVYKRHLRRSETPYIFRGVPMPLLERVMGRMLVLKAFKPLSAAISVPRAA